MYLENHESRNGLNPALAPGEYIIMRLKPRKSAYIGDKSLSMLPIALLWMVFDFSAIRTMLSDPGMDWSMILFFGFHLMPVWLWLGNLLTAMHQWKNELYFITNQRILIYHGLFTPNRDSVHLSGLRTTQVRVDWVDRLFGTGDVLLNYERHRRSTSGFFLINLDNPYEVLDRIDRLSVELKSREDLNHFEGGGGYAYSDTQ